MKKGIMKRLGTALLAGMLCLTSLSLMPTKVQAAKLFVRFVLSKAVITHGLELMLAFLTIIQGVMNTIMNTAGLLPPGKIGIPGP